MQLARPDTPLPLNKILFASGYGYDPERDILNDIDQLMTVEVNILNKCSKDLKGEDEDLICADELALDQNVCQASFFIKKYFFIKLFFKQGDSGAALRDIDANIFGL